MAGHGERADALFRDPFAARLAGPRGKEIVKSFPRAPFVGWSVAVRTVIMSVPAATWSA